MESYAVVLLKQNRFIVVKKNWIQNPVAGAKSRVFYSPDKNVVADYRHKSKYFFNSKKTQCYEGTVVKFYQTYEDAIKYTEWKRPIIPVRYTSSGSHAAKHVFAKQKVVEKIDLLGSDTETDNVTQSESENNSSVESIIGGHNDTVTNGSGAENGDQSDDTSVHSDDSQLADDEYDDDTNTNGCKGRNGNNTDQSGMTPTVPWLPRSISFLKRSYKVNNNNGSSNKSLASSGNTDVTHSVDSSDESIIGGHNNTVTNGSDAESGDQGDIASGGNMENDTSALSLAYSGSSESANQTNSSVESIVGSHNDTVTNGSDAENGDQEGIASGGNAEKDNNNVEPRCADGPANSNVESNVPTDDTMARIKLETEVTNLRTALSRMNNRVGDEEIVDSSDNSSVFDGILVGSPKANTRHFQVDNIFASTYYYITNTDGDRLYLDGTVKIKYSMVQQLKNMCSVYPSNSEDFDQIFLTYLLHAVFTKNELEAVAMSKSLRTFPVPVYKLVKKIFMDRVGDDRKRTQAFRNLVLETCSKA